MKKLSMVKVGIGVIAAAFFAFLPGKTLAADGSIKIGGEELWVASGSETNGAETAKYTASTKTLEFNGLDTTTIIINVPDALTIKLGNNGSHAASINATGNITMTGTKTLELSGNYKVKGDFNLNGPSLVMLTGDLEVTDGNLKLTKGSVSAKNITLKDNDNAKQAKITISEDANFSVTGGVSAVYNYTTTTKGITLASALCTTPFTSIINIDGASGTTTAFSIDGNSAAAGGFSTTTTCTEENPEVPDTLDAVYIYAIILVVSSAIFIYRRHLAKR